MNTIRILLADDHALVRAGIRMLLRSLEGVELVAEAENGRQALELIETLRPDVALLDVSMPELGGIEAAARIQADFPQTRVLILSMHAGEAYVAQALRSGAAGYLLKDSTPAELELALRSAVRGETYLSPRVSAVVVRGFVRSGDEQLGQMDKLTPRQRELLKLIAEGLSTKQIAAQLCISIRTVQSHRAELMERLAMRDKAGLVRFAIRTGLVTDD